MAYRPQPLSQRQKLNSRASTAPGSSPPPVVTTTRPLAVADLPSMPAVVTSANKGWQVGQGGSVPVYPGDARPETLPAGFAAQLLPAISSPHPQNITTAITPQQQPYPPYAMAAGYGTDSGPVGPRPEPEKPPPSPSPQRPTDGRQQNTWVNCLKDSSHAVQLSELLPTLTLVGASFIHHARHRDSKVLVPFERTRGFLYLYNALFAVQTYGFAKENGLIKPGMLGLSSGRSRDLTPNTPDARKLLQDIAGSLFLPAPRPGMPQQFDDRWAVPQPIAKEHYNSVYHGAALHMAGPQALGGAAAIQALRDEPHGSRQLSLAAPEGHRHEHLVLERALSEADHLLARKAEKCRLGAGDTLENVGRIAMATIDCARSVQLSNVVPALTLFGAAAIHHFGNGKADRMVPFSEQRWYKRINNLIFAYALYDTAKSNGVISSPSSASANNIRGFSMDSSDTATGQEFASRLHNIASSLFLTGPDSQEQFDVRWAVRMNEAEQNYHEIYTEDANILNYDVYAMGGAAATKALCDEPELQNRAPLFPQQSYNHRLTLMGTALLEAERLLDRKSAHGSLTAYETLDNVGRIAIATLIKIKDNLV
ncbi:hypothetical protein GGF46_005196 [Coemansia sp. RSA 552]|nr:hypothetical protein GGF46_005196 [Coemansia sp. RSA 552]